MTRIAALDTGESLFFSHQDPQTVEWFMSIVRQPSSKPFLYFPAFPAILMRSTV